MEWLTQKRLQIYPWLFIAAYITIYIWESTGIGMFDRTGKYIGYDFLCFYTASGKVLSGDVSGIYDICKFHEFEQQIVGQVAYNGLLPWFYPPFFLMFISPLAILPYLPSLCFWLTITLAGYIAVVHKIAPHPYTVSLALAFPATFQNFGYAQNGFLSAFLMGTGLLLLGRRPVAAGVMLGLLAYKPQLALLVAIALIAARMWLAFTTACVTVIVLMISSAALYGIESWQAFYNTLPLLQLWMNSGAGLWEKMQTIFAFARLTGLDALFAYGLQSIFSIGAMVVVAWVWYRHIFPMAYVILIASVFLVTPYAMIYDLTIAGLAIAWYSWHAFHHGWMQGEKAVLVLAWLTPLFSTIIAKFISIQLEPIILLAIIILAVRRVKVEMVKQ